MILGLIGTLILYYILWRLYRLVIPHIVGIDTPGFIKEPNFWQFAICLFIVLFFIRKLQ